MLISEIDRTTTEGLLLMQAIKLRAIETDTTVQDCLNTIEQYGLMAGSKPLPVTQPYDMTADLLNQVRHLESENNRLQEALNNK